MRPAKDLGRRQQLRSPVIASAWKRRCDFLQASGSLYRAGSSENNSNSHRCRESNEVPVLKCPRESNSLLLPCSFPCSIFVPEKQFSRRMCSLENRGADFRCQNSSNSLYFSLLAGNFDEATAVSNPIQAPYSSMATEKACQVRHAFSSLED